MFRIWWNHFLFILDTSSHLINVAAPNLFLPICFLNTINLISWEFITILWGGWFIFTICDKKQCKTSKPKWLHFFRFTTSSQNWMPGKYTHSIILNDLQQKPFLLSWNQATHTIQTWAMCVLESVTKTSNSIKQGKKHISLGLWCLSPLSPRASREFPMNTRTRTVDQF